MRALLPFSAMGFRGSGEALLLLLSLFLRRLGLLPLLWLLLELRR